MVGVILVVYQRYDWIVDRICDASNGGGMGGGVCCVMWGRGLMIDDCDWYIWLNKKFIWHPYPCSDYNILLIYESKILNKKIDNPSIS